MTISVTLSIVIPAYNEREHVRGTIAAARISAEAAGLSPFEIIVAADASTDGTAAIAREAGARVVPSGRRNIGATRNVGAAAARGHYLLFLDADTLVNPAAMAALARAMRWRVIGGGAILRWTEPVGRAGEWPLAAWNRISRMFHLPAGGFFFVRRDAFETVGGFDEEYFASEEIHLARKLQRLGRLVILRDPVATSPRKLRDFTRGEILGFFARALLRPRRTLRDRRQLRFWYERR